MSDAILRVLEVFEDIKRERETGDARTDRQVISDVLERIADGLDVRPVAVLGSIVTELKPDVTSVEKLERAIDDWLKGGSELKRILNKQARDQNDARAVAELFRHPVARAKSKGSGKKAAAVAETPPPTKKAKPDRKAEAAAEAAAEARARAHAAEQAEAEAREQAEAAAQAAAEARLRVQAAEKAEAEARARAQAAEKAEAEARARAEAAEKAEAKARARAKAAEQAEAEARDRTEAEARERAEAASDESPDAAEAGEPLRRVTLDEDVAAFFTDERAVNDFLRASIAAMRHARRNDEDDDR